MTARSLPPSFSGKLAQMPWDAGSRKQRLERSRQRQIVDQNPANFVPEFDVIYELQCNRESYSIGDDAKSVSLTIYEFPLVCDISLSTTRTKVGRPKPSVDTTIACCISNGVSEINGDEHIEELIKLREKFNKVDTSQDGDEITLIASWFKSFKMDIPTSGDRKNLRLPIGIHYSLSQLAEDIGVKVGSLAVIAMMLTLADQICINKDHCKTMQAHVDKFLKMAKFRVVSTRAIMTALSGLETEGINL